MGKSGAPGSVRVAKKSTHLTLNMLEHFETLPYPLVKNLYMLGFDTPTEVQKRAIPYLRDHKSIIASAPTGSGKTGAFAVACYLNTTIASPVTQCVVVSPTRELCE